ncbi:DNPEP isoform 13 [Pan troglodytes]|uniref:Aspartyl aminopeptidase n=2 Tax=Homininae TaxID=207598 RepID=E3W979_HUMAN|nr:DNPEP isoform 8 [Pan troglodytes]PNI70701.1 DNPEP isoform 13 [Pan troglodytes]
MSGHSPTRGAMQVSGSRRPHLNFDPRPGPAPSGAQA